MTIELEHWRGIPHSYQLDQEIRAFFSEISELEEIFPANFWSILSKYAV
jgi:hypothetical protein